MNGRLALDFDEGGMRVMEQQPPWKVVRAFESDSGQRLVHLHNLSGGVLGGDQLHLCVNVASGANVQVTSTGATRIYRAREGKPPSRSVATFRVGSDAVLEYLPDPLIPYADSDFEQETKIFLDDGATLFWWEMIAPGREAMGEVFAYRRLSVCAEISSADGPIVIERMRIGGAQNSPAQFGGFRYSSTLYICRPASGDWRKIEHSLNEIAVQLSLQDGVRWGVSALHRHGVVVRGLNTRSSGIAGALVQFWRAAKLLLCASHAVLPRKTY